MIRNFKPSNNKFKYEKSNLNFAVIGHIEWINFLKVDKLPKPGIISHAEDSLELPAGGGTLIANTLSELTHNQVHFFTSLGNDYFGKESYKILEKKGLKLHVNWREAPTRRGFSLIDNSRDRSITIIGKRLAPKFTDNLDWDILNKMDGIFITAADKQIFKKARNAKILCTTPRVGIDTINNSNVVLDGIIGSDLDPDEFFIESDLIKKPKYIIKTEGEKGGFSIPGGKFNAIKNDLPLIDSYGCGDSFAAGIIFGLSSKWSIEKTIKLGTVLGRNSIESYGPYPNMSKIIK